jgi:hypothetical protein
MYRQYLAGMPYLPSLPVYYENVTSHLEEINLQGLLICSYIQDLFQDLFRKNWLFISPYPVLQFMKVHGRDVQMPSINTPN